jgi:hypothetical protein
VREATNVKNAICAVSVVVWTVVMDGKPMDAWTLVDVVVLVDMIDLDALVFHEQLCGAEFENVWHLRSPATESPACSAGLGWGCLMKKAASCAPRG